MLDVLGEDGLKLTPGEDEHPVEAFPADGADEALGEGVRPRSSDRRADDPDPFDRQFVAIVPRSRRIWSVRTNARYKKVSAMAHLRR